MADLSWIKDAGGIAGMIIFAYLAYRLVDRHWGEGNEKLGEMSVTLVEVSQTLKGVRDSMVYDREVHIKQQDDIVVRLDIIASQLDKKVRNCPSRIANGGLQ